MDVATNGSPDPALSPPKMGPREPDSIPHALARNGSTSSADSADLQQRQPLPPRVQATGHDKNWQARWREWLTSPQVAGLKTWQLLLLVLLPFLPAITIALAASLPILVIGVVTVFFMGFAMTPMLVLAAVLFLAFFPAQRRWLLQLVQRVASSLHLLRPLPHGQQQPLQSSQPAKHSQKSPLEGFDLTAEQEPARSPITEPALVAADSAVAARKPVENGSSGRVVVASSPRLRNGPAVTTTSPRVVALPHPEPAPPAETVKAKVAGTGGASGKSVEGVRAAGKAASAAEQQGSPKAAGRGAFSPAKVKAETNGKPSEGESPAKLKEDKREDGNANKPVVTTENGKPVNGKATNGKAASGKAENGAVQPGAGASGNGGGASGGKKSGGAAKGQGKGKGKGKRG